MFKRMTGIKTIAAFLIIPIILLSSGCGKGGKKNKGELQSGQGQQSEEKAPKLLKEIEENMEKLFETLGGPAAKKGDSEKGGSETTQEQGAKQATEHHETQQQGTKEDTKQQEGKQQEGKQQEGKQETSQQETTQQNGKQQGDKQKINKQQEPQQQDKQQDTGKWSEVDSIINNLHYQWNAFMPEVSKKGADAKIIDNFDNALNTLTTSVVSKDNKKVMAAANMLYSHVADLYSLYRTKMSPEEKRIIYYCRNIILESENENWETVKQDNEQLEKSWALFRNTLDEKQKEISQKLDFSLYELDKVIEQQNKQLTSIKGEIVLSNIKELEKSFEKS